MRILAVLWTVCLVRLCSAGCCGGGTTDDDDPPQSVEPTITTPFTLDLTSPDEAKLDVYTETESGVSFKGYSPKDAFHVSSVMDAGVTVWKSSGDEKCLLAECYARGGLELLYLETSGGTGTTLKYFEKNGTEWTSIEREDYDQKIEEMRKMETTTTPH